MEINKAIETIKSSWLWNTANENIQLKEAISVLMQAIDNSVSKDKIKEIMEEADEEAFSKPYDVDTADGYHSQWMGRWCVCRELLEGK